MLAFQVFREEALIVLYFDSCVLCVNATCALGDEVMFYSVFFGLLKQKNGDGAQRRTLVWSFCPSNFECCAGEVFQATSRTCLLAIVRRFALE